MSLTGKISLTSKKVTKAFSQISNKIKIHGIKRSNKIATIKVLPEIRLLKNKMIMQK